MAAHCLLDKLIKLLIERSFIVKPSNFLKRQHTHNVYSYGPPGALLRHNILQEWRRYVLYNNEETFWVENSKSITAGTPSDTSIGVEHYNSSILHHCPENYLVIAKQLNKKLSFSVAHTSVCFDLQRTSGENRSFLESSENTELTVTHFCPSTTIVSSFSDCHRRRLKWWRQYARFPSNFILSDPQQLNVNNETFQLFKVQFHFPWGWDTIETIINWRDYPLQGIKDVLLSDISAQSKIRRSVSLPCVIESTAILERAFLAFLLDSFQESIHTNSKSKTRSESKTRSILKLHRRLVPYKIGISVSGSKASYLRKMALRIIKDIENLELQVFHRLDTTNSLEKQYVMFDELGVLLTIVINDSTLESGIIGLRSRDTSLKEPLHVATLKDTILKNIQ
ncbi:DNA polymerase subunit gamma-2, mitochondrial [Octopus bimaculoides]|uniref:Anticodon-binding domain-containing protein n=1 Tax=Octopus bimaculoides TaxID=37653 RepID=A0A0L8HTC5_OCTBM|nr:DNA polymerase subunit gamma-2, mitochondrial [Octopus bimaculoides]|eukprot:XP_014769911.1 PREDICTED: DNA polymerase subunit gamma-2, mitochondrial-like [Octopus bimaculoides]